MPSPNATSTAIHALNRSFLLLAREMAHEDIVEASIATGLSEEMLRTLSQAPLPVMEDLANTRVCGFSPRFDEEALHSFLDTYTGDDSTQRPIAKLRLVSSAMLRSNH